MNIANDQHEPLNKEEAAVLFANTQHLAGRVISSSNNCKEVIEGILLAPGDAFNKWFFFNYYMESRNNEEALSFYKYPFYDVLAIIQVINAEGEVSYTYRSVRKLETIDNQINVTR